MEQNTLGDLNQVLFNELDRLVSADSEDAVRVEVSRAKAVKEVAETILENSRCAMDAVKLGYDIAGGKVATVAAPLTMRLSDGSKA